MLQPHSPLSLDIKDPSMVGQARRNASALAAQIGFGETDRGRVSIIVSEAAKNLIEHAGGGTLLLSDADGALQILSLDKGPGMVDVGRCMRDGYSTRGTPGTGLGAMQRLSTIFDIHSIHGVGTAVLCLVRPTNAPIQSGTKLTWGAAAAPKTGETISGDAWAALERPARVMVADGLGHGPRASDAAREAVRIFNTMSRSRSITDLLDAMHTALRPTRGAAVSIAEFDTTSRQIRYVGVGNIAGAVLPPDGKTRQMVSHNGTVGHEVRKIQEFTYAWEPGHAVVLSSDGVAHWRVDRYPGLLTRHPALVAGVLFRDYHRGRDDATVVVVREC